jgi:hypothetical protein
MRRLPQLVSMLLVFGLIIAGGLGLAQAQPLAPRVREETSRGVIILPGPHLASLAGLHAGDTPNLAGQRVKVRQTDPQVGLLVSSATMQDAELAQTLVSAGLAAEVNYPRHILPVTPTAELFSTPHVMRPADLSNQPDFWHVGQIGADIVHKTGATGAAP